MIDYEPYVTPNPEPDVDMLQLAIDVHTLRGTVNTRAMHAIFYMLDGVYVAREDKNGIAFFRIHDPAEA